MACKADFWTNDSEAPLGSCSTRCVLAGHSAVHAHVVASPCGKGTRAAAGGSAYGRCTSLKYCGPTARDPPSRNHRKQTEEATKQINA